MSAQAVAGVAVDTPQHAGLASVLDYACAQAPPPGTLVRVPLGARTVTGIVWSDAQASSLSHLAGHAPGRTPGDGAAAERVLRPLGEVMQAVPALPEAWRRLAGDLDLRKLGSMVSRVGLADVPDLAGRILQGQVRGRVVVNVRS